MSSSSDRSLRSALVSAMLPSPRPGLPAAKELDLDAFWLRFEASAPLHLRIGFRAATALIAGALPIAFGYRRTLPALNEDDRDAVLQRAFNMPAIAPLFDVIKIVVAFAYFDRSDVEDHIRGRA